MRSPSWRAWYDKAIREPLGTVFEGVPFKPYPKTRAGRRTVPLPAFAVELLVAHRAMYAAEPDGLSFLSARNTAGRFGRRFSVMGHENASTTLDRYIHASRDHTTVCVTCLLTFWGRSVPGCEEDPSEEGS